MSTVNPILNRSITLEFFIDCDKKICCFYNGVKYSFNDYWKKIPDADEISRYTLEQFKYQFPDKYHRAALGSKGWKETFIRIINNHMRTLDDKLDVFIHTSGDVTFQLEFP